MTTLAERSPAWHADRRTGIGSSDAPIITGDAPWGDLLTLYAVKARIIDEPDLDTPQTAWGRKLEATVAEWFSEATGRKVQRVNRRLRHRTHDWMHASLDRRVVGASALLECKTRRFPTDEWGPGVILTPGDPVEEDEARLGAAEVPAHYVVQVQHQLAVTGYDVGYLAVLFAGSDPRYYAIPRDEALIADLIALEAEFMDAVRNGTPPEALIRRQRPVIPYRDGEITADETLATGIEGVYHARQEVKALKEQLALAEAAVKTLLGPNTAARAGAYRATFKPNADSHPVRWELVAAAYRKWIEQTLGAGVASLDATAPDLDAIESLFTDLKPGARVLRITEAKEARDAA